MWRRRVSSVFNSPKSSFSFRYSRRRYGSNAHDHGHGHDHSHQDLRGCTATPPNYQSPNARDEIVEIFKKPVIFLAAFLAADTYLATTVEEGEPHPFATFTISLYDTMCMIGTEFANWASGLSPEERELRPHLLRVQARGLETKKVRIAAARRMQAKRWKYDDPYQINFEQDGEGKNIYRVELDREEKGDYVIWPSVSVPRTN